MKILRISLLLLIICLFLTPSQALAQTYYFSVDKEEVNVYWQSDGTASIDYVIVFSNSTSASPIDYVDIGIPNSNFDTTSITADVNGTPVNDISRSGFQGKGDAGVAVGLGNLAIRPGQTGQVHVFIGVVRDVLRMDSKDSKYASAVFSPNWFGSEYVTGTTDLTVIYHLPAEVKPEEPRWHAAPAGFPSEPEAALDQDERIVYIWHNPQASGSIQYRFGASFPAKYVPASAVPRPSIWETLGIDQGTFFGGCFCVGLVLFIFGMVYTAFRTSERRKLQYLPPRIAIEGHGIKRGLTAIEAAILLEQPLDKILTMILFAVIKKNAASVVTRDPLEIKATDPQPADLQPYEVKFLEAFKETDKAKRRKLLQEMMIDLVQTLSSKMKGFSRRETIDYYRDIIKRAWEQVETAGTPEVKSEKYNEVMEWTMLDKNYDQRTQDVFRTGPVFVPIWWPRYDPGFGRGATTIPSGGGPAPSIGPTPGGGLSLPHLPGADFAASLVKGTQSFSSSVVGNVAEFTSGVTQKTNPVPITTSSGTTGGSRSGGGSSGGSTHCVCACACACAGCACACAGGGR